MKNEPYLEQRIDCERKCYVVTAYRWGNHELHSYVVGAFDSFDLAKKAAEYEEVCRGGKYDCEIICFEINQPSSYRKIDFEPDYSWVKIEEEEE